jgi:NlpC/P60 family putative phage cell wall peptidase
MMEGSTGEATAAAVVAEALSWVGTPYRHQGARKGVGCDCLGLLLGVWRALYGREPEEPGPYAADWAEAGGEDRFVAAARRHCREQPAGELLPGHVVLFRWRSHLPAKHAGIVVARERFVHAYEGSAVVVSTLVPQWRSRIAGIFAFPDLPTTRSPEI